MKRMEQLAIRVGFAVCVVAIVFGTAAGQGRRPAVRRAPGPAETPIRTINVPFAAARPVLDGLPDRVPADLQGKTTEERAAYWPGWVARRDAEIRKRLEQGDADTIVNFMLFGVTFTKQPRATAREIARLVEAGKTPDAIIIGRIQDLAAAIASPGQNERVQFARAVVERNGLDPTTPEGRQATQLFLAESTQRVLREVDSYRRAIEAAKLGDASAEFAERSTLYRERGLSSDTSLSPDYGIETALGEMKAKGLFAPGSIRAWRSSDRDWTSRTRARDSTSIPSRRFSHLR